MHGHTTTVLNTNVITTPVTTIAKAFYKQKSNKWRQTKRLTGQVGKQDLAGLANELTDGNLQKLTNNINSSLINVPADLTMLTTVDVSGARYH